MNRKTDSSHLSGIITLSDPGIRLAPPAARKTPQPPHAGAVMSRRICICCGEPMGPGSNALSRNPHVCASCSSLADGMEEEGNPAVELDAADDLDGRGPTRQISRNAGRRFA